MIPLEPEKYYHIYNHANGFDNLFLDDFDYQKFLAGYQKYVVPITDSFAYCLMPNHFHFFVRFHEEQKLRTILSEFSNTSPDRNIEDIISKRISHFFNSYAQSFNKKYKRTGALFLNSVERKVVNTEKYFVTLVHYIHSNPVNHGYRTNIKDWKYSSYNSIISEEAGFIEKQVVIDYFNDMENFKFVHQNPYSG